MQVREGNKKPLYLMTVLALQPGQYVDLDNGVKLTVISASPDGCSSASKPPVSEKVTLPKVSGADSRAAIAGIESALISYLSQNYYEITRDHKRTLCVHKG